MWFRSSVEFPSDNHELWRALPPKMTIDILVAPEPAPEPEPEVEIEIEPGVPSLPLEDIVLAEFSDDAFADAVDDSVPPPPLDVPVPLESMVAPKMAPDDPSRIYVRTLKEVAVAFGASAVFAETLDAVLGYEPLCVDVETGKDLVARGLAEAIDDDFEPLPAIVKVAAAWRSAFQGDEPDFSVCSAMLDEWSADVVARLLGKKELAEQVRRELRSRGVAAFGLLEAA
jgi:hypothetical protein